MRVVSLVPSFTETLFTLGLEPGKHVVGVTRWCVHPADKVAAVEKVGGTKNPDVPRILALGPDVVIGNREENRREDVEALEAGGARVLLRDVGTVDEASEAVRDIARAVDLEAAGEALAAAIDAVIRDVRDAAAGRARVRVYCPIWRRPWMTVGGDTFASSVLDAVGAVNVYADAARYPEASPSEARARGADVALLPSEPYPFAVKHVREVVEAGFPRARVRLVDGEALTWYGSRMRHGLPAIARDVATVADAVSA